MSERSEGYRKTSVKPCGYTSWPQTREMLPRRAHWLVLMEPRPHQNDARIAMQLGRAYEAAKDFGAARTNYFKAADRGNAYLGMSVKTLLEVYGHHHPEYLKDADSKMTAKPTASASPQKRGATTQTNVIKTQR